MSSSIRACTSGGGATNLSFTFSSFAGNCGSRTCSSAVSGVPSPSFTSIASGPGGVSTGSPTSASFFSPRGKNSTGRPANEATGTAAASTPDSSSSTASPGFASAGVTVSEGEGAWASETRRADASARVFTERLYDKRATPGLSGRLPCDAGAEPPL